MSIVTREKMIAARDSGIQNDWVYALPVQHETGKYRGRWGVLIVNRDSTNAYIQGDLDSRQEAERLARFLVSPPSDQPDYTRGESPDQCESGDL